MEMRTRISPLTNLDCHDPALQPRMTKTGAMIRIKLKKWMVERIRILILSYLEVITATDARISDL